MHVKQIRYIILYTLNNTKRHYLKSRAVRLCTESRWWVSQLLAGERGKWLDGAVRTLTPPCRYPCRDLCTCQRRQNDWMVRFARWHRLVDIHAVTFVPANDDKMIGWCGLHVDTALSISMPWPLYPPTTTKWLDGAVRTLTPPCRYPCRDLCTCQRRQSDWMARFARWHRLVDIHAVTFVPANDDKVIGWRGSHVDTALSISMPWPLYLPTTKKWLDGAVRTLTPPCRYPCRDLCTCQRRQNDWMVRFARWHRLVDIHAVTFVPANDKKMLRK